MTGYKICYSIFSEYNDKIIGCKTMDCRELHELLCEIYPDKRIFIRKFDSSEFTAEIYNKNKFVYKIKGIILFDKIYIVRDDCIEMIVYAISRETRKISDIILTINRAHELTIYDETEFNDLLTNLTGYDDVLQWFLRFPRFRWYLLSLIDKVRKLKKANQDCLEMYLDVK